MAPADTRNLGRYLSWRVDFIRTLKLMSPIDPRTAHHVFNNLHELIEPLIRVSMIHLLCVDKESFEKITFHLGLANDEGSRLQVFSRALEISPEAAANHLDFYCTSFDQTILFRALCRFPIPVDHKAAQEYFKYLKNLFPSVISPEYLSVYVTNIKDAVPTKEQVHPDNVVLLEMIRAKIQSAIREVYSVDIWK